MDASVLHTAFYAELSEAGGLHLLEKAGRQHNNPNSTSANSTNSNNDRTPLRSALKSSSRQNSKANQRSVLVKLGNVSDITALSWTLRNNVVNPNANGNYSIIPYGPNYSSDLSPETPTLSKNTDRVDVVGQASPSLVDIGPPPTGNTVENSYQDPGMTAEKCINNTSSTSTNSTSANHNGTTVPNNNGVSTSTVGSPFGNLWNSNTNPGSSPTTPRGKTTSKSRSSGPFGLISSSRKSSKNRSKESNVNSAVTNGTDSNLPRNACGPGKVVPMYCLRINRKADYGKYFQEVAEFLNQFDLVLVEMQGLYGGGGVVEGDPSFDFSGGPLDGI